ncbi:hypothetical protein ACFQZJ_02495 [Maribacter chungangensis]|uniref:Uncharacterized protein n=1 Tax=Maribacter chungangensis TaxID=1069117 RepID=A0ABW3AZV0_9FLAO
MEEFIIRADPQLKIVLFDNRFEIHEPEEAIRAYMLKEIDSLQVGKRVNWFISAISVVIGFFIGDAGDIYKERDQLKFNHKGRPAIVSLRGGDQNVTLKVAE